MGNPINQNNNKDLNLTSKGVKWEGPSIPCLDLCHGDTVNSVVIKIAEKLCKLVDDHEDLATLDYSCVIDLCQTENCADLDDPTKVSLKGIFQILLNNDCKLKDLIDAVETQITTVVNGGIVLGNLELGCLTAELTAICRDIENYTLNDLLQCYINILCDHETTLVDLSSRILTLEQLVCSLSNIAATGIYTEPDIDVSCITGNPAPDNEIHSDATQIIVTKVCEIETNLGSESDVNNALAQACLTDFLSNPDIIQTPTNLAQDEKNKWIVICSALERLKDIEDNCCSPICDDIKIGFSLDSFSEGPPAEYTLKFNNGTGTSIPLGFTDCGSTITLSDQHGNTLTVPITITNNTTEVIDVTSLFVTDPITAKINTCFTHTNGLECVDCFTQTIPAQTAGCKICKLCADNGAAGDQIQVQYHTDADPTVQTVILTQGACLTFDLPDETPTIDSITVITTGSLIEIVTDGDCDPGLVIPTPIDPTCWFFPLPVPTPFAGIYVEGSNCAIPDGDVDSSYIDDASLIYTYSEIETDNGNISISGNIASYVTTASTLPSNSGSDSITMDVIVPVAIFSQYVDCYTASGQVLFDDAGPLNTCAGGAGQLESVSTTPGITTSPWGLYIKLYGQTTTPLLKLVDPLTGQNIYSKGEITLVCPC